MSLKAGCILLCVILIAAVSCHQRTEEDSVREVMDSLIRLAEQRDLEGMLDRLSEDFIDFEGRDKEELRSLLRSYFVGRSGIVVHRLSGQVNLLKEKQAIFETEVALSSGGAEALRRLVRVSPDIYRLRIELIKGDDGWRISYAEWTWINLTELLPESLSALKKIFPRI